LLGSRVDLTGVIPGGHIYLRRAVLSVVRSFFTPEPDGNVATPAGTPSVLWWSSRTAMLARLARRRSAEERRAGVAPASLADTGVGVERRVASGARRARVSSGKI
jgi:hypothetical protein